MTVDEYEQWIERHFELFRQALADPSVRFELLLLLGGDDADARRRRFQEAADQEIKDHELRWQRREGD